MIGAISEMTAKRKCPCWSERDEELYQEMITVCRVPLLDDAARKSLMETEIAIARSVIDRSAAKHN